MCPGHPVPNNREDGAGWGEGINFTQEELQLLYAACMSYGDKLAEVMKNIPNEGEIVLGRLSGRAKGSWNLAKKITGYMEG